MAIRQTNPDFEPSFCGKCNKMDKSDMMCKLWPNTPSRWEPYRQALKHCRCQYYEEVKA